MLSPGPLWHQDMVGYTLRPAFNASGLRGFGGRSCDFRTQKPFDKLMESGYDPAKKTLFVMPIPAAHYRRARLKAGENVCKISFLIH